VKLGATGHLFVTPESVGPNLTFVASTTEYASRMEHAWNQVFGFNNPNRFVAYVLLLAVLLAALRTPRSDSDREARVRPGSDVVVLLVGLFATQLGLWSLRRYPALMRYFIVVYPALYLVAFAVLARALERHARAGIAVVVAPLALAFVASWNPAYRRFFPAPLASALALPPNGVSTNHENSLDVIDQLETFRQAVAELDALASDAHDGATVAVAWPYDSYLSSPEHLMTSRLHVVMPWSTVSTATPRPRFALATSSRDSTRTPSTTSTPLGYRQQAVFARGRAWTLLLQRE
jgi:hypothetical protein